MINQKIFNESIQKFEKIESRTNFFRLSKKLIIRGFKTEGYLLLLTTWNFASFRYATKDFDIEYFEKIIISIQPLFKKLHGQNFRKINFEYYRNEIEIIYNSLSCIKGVEYTGASKLLHLACPQVFVIWDGYIRGDKSNKYYTRIKTKIWKRKKYKKDSSGYIEFLKDMQVYYKNIKLKRGGRTFAKAIDECNYVNITIPIQKMEKKDKDQKQMLNIQRNRKMKLVK